MPDDAVERWELGLGDVSETVGTGLVCFATRAGRDVVLKIASPHGEHFTGMEAMRVYGSPACVPVIDTAEEGTQMLMGCVLPGTHLYELESEDEEVCIAAWLP